MRRLCGEAAGGDGVGGRKGAFVCSMQLTLYVLDGGDKISVDPMKTDDGI